MIIMATRCLNYKFSGRFYLIDQKNTNTRESSTVDSFYKVNDVSSDDGEKCVHFADPIYIIFNDERLKQMGADSALKYIESLTQNMKSNPLTDLRKQCSDEDLLSTIKSRHFQSPSEILNWTRYMSNNLDEFNKAVESAKAQYDAQQQKQNTTTAE